MGASNCSKMASAPCDDAQARPVPETLIQLAPRPEVVGWTAAAWLSSVGGVAEALSKALLRESGVSESELARTRRLARLLGSAEGSTAALAELLRAGRELRAG